MKTFTRVIAVAAAMLAAATAQAGEIGHYNPGVLNIRDYVMPDPGFYGVVYNYYYKTDRLNDPAGNEIRSVNINPGPGPGIDVGLDVDVNIYALVPTLIWTTELPVPHLKYGAFVAPVFANGSVEAELVTAHDLGGGVSNSTFNIGDMLVQPVWLAWNPEHFDTAFGYGFYAPTGQYNTRPVTLPNGTTIRTESPDNIGYGFWTQQLQATGAYYPWADKRMALVLAGTYEFNQEKEDFDLTPGNVFTLNWGLSQFLPLTKDHQVLAEIGVAGYDSWQVTADSGRDANHSAKDDVNAVGGEIAVAHLPWGAMLAFHYFYEFSSEDRFQGHVLSLSLAKKVF